MRQLDLELSAAFQLDAVFIAADRLVSGRAENSYLLPQTMEGIARKFMLNEFKLKKGFREMFGNTVFGHIHGLSMRHAAKLLPQNGGMRVGEVAVVVGYGLDSSFVQAFRLFFCCSPEKLN